MNCDCHLLEIVDADALQGFRFRPAEHRQKQGSENGNNGHNHESLDQAEGTSRWPMVDSTYDAAVRPWCCEAFQGPLPRQTNNSESKSLPWLSHFYKSRPFQ